MCGIAGWFGARSGDVPGTLRAMADSIAHRGPDGEGFLELGAAALAHRRLAIVDLEAGAQPMRSVDGDLAISFNGEIYNYRELREVLLAKGAEFATHSDTEVIIAAYRCWGIEGLARLRGMYAFALWDNARAEGYLVRDPLGIKPLFFSRQSRCLLFGSEVKAILASGAIDARLSEPALHQLLNLRYLPGNDSLFRGVEQLPPGGVLHWRQDAGTRLSMIATPDLATPDDPLDALHDSVRAHQVADVEVGCYLSGGIDSATIAALVARDNPGSRSFTLAVGDDPREAANAAETARLLGLENDTHPGELQAAQRLQQLTWHLEVPKVNALQIDSLAAHASRSVKVALSGLGGDELFLGYNAHRILAACTRLAPAGALVRPLGSLAAVAARGLRTTPWSETERACLMAASTGNWSRVYGLLRNAWDSPRLRRWLYGPRMLDASLEDAFDRLAGDWPDHADPVMAMRDSEWRGKMVNDLLWQEDRCSMAHGLEVRTPLVDTRLKSRFWSLDRSTLMPGGEAKGYMKQVVADLLPDAVLRRPKSGFQVSAGAFFHAELAQLAADWLSPGRVAHYGLFNPETVMQLRNLPPQTRYRWHFFLLYLMLGTHMWLATFEEGAGG